MPAPLNETPAVWRAFLPVFITSCEAAGYDSYGLHRATLASARYGKYSTRPLVWAQHSVTAANIVKLMKEMAKEFNQTFIVVTHDRQQFPDVDRVITIKDGRSFEGEQPKMELVA